MSPGFIKRYALTIHQGMLRHLRNYLLSGDDYMHLCRTVQTRHTVSFCRDA